MVATVAAAAMPVPVNVLAWEQPVNRVPKIGLRAAAGLDQRDASGGMRNKDIETQPVAPLATELNDHLGDVGDKSSSGTQLYDIGLHFPITAWQDRFLMNRDVGLDPVIHRPAGVKGVDDEPPYSGGVAELGPRNWRCALTAFCRSSSTRG